MKLVDRDKVIFRTLHKFSFLTSRHINLMYFHNQRACDRRLKILYENKYLKRQKVLVGYPYLYSLNKDSYKVIGTKVIVPKIRVDRIGHDIAVLDSVIYIMQKHNILVDAIITEKQLHSHDGFSVRKHHPDFVFYLNEKSYCVECELTLKAIDKFKQNIEDNFITYDNQVWIVPNSEYRIRQVLRDSMTIYTNIQIVSLEGVQEYVNNL